MWLKLANATFTNNLGTLSSLMNSYSITYSLTGGLTKTSGASYLSKASGQNYANLSENFVATFTLGTGAEYTSTSITVGGNTLSSSYYSASESSGTVTVTIPTTSAQQITGNVVINVVATAGSSTPTVTNYTFTINATPATATVVLSASGYTDVTGTGAASITVADGTSISYTVSNTGYTTQTNSYTINGSNHNINISLNEIDYFSTMTWLQGGYSNTAEYDSTPNTNATRLRTSVSFVARTTQITINRNDNWTFNYGLFLANNDSPTSVQGDGSHWVKTITLSSLTIGQTYILQLSINNNGTEITPSNGDSALTITEGD